MKFLFFTNETFNVYICLDKNFKSIYAFLKKRPSLHEDMVYLWVEVAPLY